MALEDNTLGIPLTTELASRLELAEAEWNIAKLTALMNDSNNSRAVRLRRSGQIQVMAIASLGHNPSYNRAFYVTVNDSGKINKVIHWLEEQKVCMWIDVVPPLVDTAVIQNLSKSSLRLVRFSNTGFAKLGNISVKENADINITTVKIPSQYHEYAIVLSSAFGIPTEILQNTADFTQVEYSSPMWKLLIATIDKQPAAIDSLYLGKHAASVSSMGTAPEFRNMGLQTAILNECIALAQNENSEIITTQVSPVSTSERNTIRSGFQIAYTKAFWGN